MVGGHNDNLKIIKCKKHPLFVSFSVVIQQKQLDEERISFGSQFHRVQSVVIWSHLLEKDIMAMGACGIRKLFTLW